MDHIPVALVDCPRVRIDYDRIVSVSGLIRCLEALEP